MPIPLSRRAFLALAGAAPFASALAAEKPVRRKTVPVGLEMYSLKDDEEKDRLATLRAVAAMGYEGVEFWGPYADWTPAYAKEVRAQLDALGLRCFSTHTRRPYWSSENLPRVIELNQILGSRYVILNHPGEVAEIDGWKQTAELLARGHERLKPSGSAPASTTIPANGKLVEGQRPIDILAANTPADFHFQLDTATCLASGGDPVAFVKANPGRVKSYHLKDWSPDQDKGYRVLLGEGIGPWKSAVRRRGVEGRRRVLPHRAGGQPVPSHGDGAPLPRELPQAARVCVVIHGRPAPQPRRQR